VSSSPLRSSSGTPPETPKIRFSACCSGPTVGTAGTLRDTPGRPARPTPSVSSGSSGYPKLRAMSTILDFISFVSIQLSGLPQLPCFTHARTIANTTALSLHLLVVAMVNLDTVRQTNAGLAKRESLTAVFVGGTNGIGQYSAHALTTSYGKGGKGLRIYIVGRSEKAGEEIVSDLRNISKSGYFQFIRAEDAALLKDVDRISAAIITAEEAASQTPKIDLLVMTQGYLNFARKGTFMSQPRRIGGFPC
jgi:hypothetical protein